MTLYVVVGVLHPGHVDFYRDGMFSQMEVEGEDYQIKPMNCPFHCLVYKDSLRSYRDLPLRWAELGTVYRQVLLLLLLSLPICGDVFVDLASLFCWCMRRYERSGTLHGLMRVRGFTQDDAHIFCLPSQLEVSTSTTCQSYGHAM